MRHKQFMVSLWDGSHFTNGEVDTRIRSALGKDALSAIEHANPGAVAALTVELTKLIRSKGRAVAEAGANEYVKDACASLRDRYHRAIEETEKEREALAAELERVRRSDPRFAWAEERAAALVQIAKESGDRYALQQAIRSSGLIIFAALGGTSVGFASSEDREDAAGAQRTRREHVGQETGDVPREAWSKESAGFR